MKESALLITDYSSVSFDFAFMNKPLIYFQFDYKDFTERHYSGESYFSYQENGFGPVVKSERDLIREIERNLNNEFHVDNFHLKRIHDTFPLRNKKNCKRIYDSILNL